MTYAVDSMWIKRRWFDFVMEEKLWMKKRI